MCLFADSLDQIASAICNKDAYAHTGIESHVAGGNVEFCAELVLAAEGDSSFVVAGERLSCAYGLADPVGHLVKLAGCKSCTQRHGSDEDLGGLHFEDCSNGENFVRA